MIRPTAYCDNCGIAKGETNRWYRAVALKQHLFLLAAWDTVHDETMADAANRVLGLNPSTPETIQHLCSESCAVKAMGKTLTGQTSE